VIDGLRIMERTVIEISKKTAGTTAPPPPRTDSTTARSTARTRHRR
jgi:hypothetical protein